MAARGRTLSAAAAAAAAAAVLVQPAGTAVGPPAGRQDALEVRVVSSPAHLISGGDARVEIAVPDAVAYTDVEVRLDGADVASAFGQDPEGGHQLEGVLAGLPLGESTLIVRVPGPGNALPNRVELALVNHPIQGPMFSGPQQAVFLCATAAHRATAGLGPITDPATCAADTVVSFLYRSTGGSWLPYDPAAPPPLSAIATTTTLDGATVPLIVRWERGVINRFIYSIAILSPASQDLANPDLSSWNGALIQKLQGGVGIGHYQGAPSSSEMLYLPGLQLGYAIAYSTGTRTGTHYNLQLGGETAIMVKDRFVSAYAEPDYTVGVGGSGGAIQQYVYGQNHPGLLDAGVPQYSYPDMVTQTIHVGDCELLERWLDNRVLANPASMWRTWTNRRLIEGLNASAVMPNPFAALMPYMPVPGSSECINGWRGLSPLALNPHFGTAPGYNPAVHGPVEWTHWADLVNIYGRDETGFARSPWDNVGVQYGLGSLTAGQIAFDEFLDLNANVGSWKESGQMVQEGCPYVSSACGSEPPDVWSARNMRLSPDGGATPAPRREGNREAQAAAYRSGMVFRGKIEIPLIDWRHYLEPFLDMHNSHQSFAARQRMLNFDGDASNQVIWFTAPGPTGPLFDQTPMALGVIDEWMANLAAHPERGVAGNKPAAAVDSCFAANGSLIASGDGVWSGVLDNLPAGACAQLFPPFATSRIVAGGPIEGGVFKCHLQPVAAAIDRGLYAPQVPTATQIGRLRAIFPSGVCDYRKGDVGMPPELHGNGSR
jgi:hypothetical protein